MVEQRTSGTPTWRESVTGDPDPSIKWYRLGPLSYPDPDPLTVEPDDPIVLDRTGYRLDIVGAFLAGMVAGMFAALALTFGAR